MDSDEEENSDSSSSFSTDNEKENYQKNVSPALFTDENGLRMRFVMDSFKGKNEIKLMIEHGGGMLFDIDPSEYQNGMIWLVSKKSTRIYLDHIEYFDCCFVKDCFQANELFDLNEYRVGCETIVPNIFERDLRQQRLEEDQRDQQQKEQQEKQQNQQQKRVQEKKKKDSILELYKMERRKDLGNEETENLNEERNKKGRKLSEDENGKEKRRKIINKKNDKAFEAVEAATSKRVNNEDIRVEVGVDERVANDENRKKLNVKNKGPPVNQDEDDTITSLESGERILIIDDDDVINNDEVMEGTGEDEGEKNKKENKNEENINKEIRKKDEKIKNQVEKTPNKDLGEKTKEDKTQKKDERMKNKDDGAKNKDQSEKSSSKRTPNKRKKVKSKYFLYEDESENDQNERVQSRNEKNDSQKQRTKLSSNDEKTNNEKNANDKKKETKYKKKGKGKKKKWNDNSESGESISGISDSDSSDISLNEDEKTVFKNKREIKVKRVRSSRPHLQGLRKNYYTLEEDQQILNYAIESKRYLDMKGMVFWKDAIAAGVCPRRTWQGIKSRFWEQIVHRLDRYDLSEKQKKRFQSL